MRLTWASGRKEEDIESVGVVSTFSSKGLRSPMLRSQHLPADACRWVEVQCALVRLAVALLLESINFLFSCPRFKPPCPETCLLLIINDSGIQRQVCNVSESLKATGFSQDDHEDPSRFKEAKRSSQ